MEYLIENTDSFLLLLVFIGATISFSFSTISGGGGALLLIPYISFLLEASKAAPIINLGALISRPSRILIFWKYIQWRIFMYYVPTAFLGAFVAGWLFTSIKIEWLQILVGLFLISTLFQFRFGKKKQSFNVPLWYFIPLGFLISIIGTFTGGMGPLLNPFYLNAGIDKEELIATKAINSFFLGLGQISSYTVFNILNPELIAYGIALGIGATVGNLIGKRLLKNISSLVFRKLTIAVMVVSGILLIIKAIR